MKPLVKQTPPAGHGENGDFDANFKGVAVALGFSNLKTLLKPKAGD